jgi:hypothetical protein
VDHVATSKARTANKDKAKHRDNLSNKPTTTTYRHNNHTTSHCNHRTHPPRTTPISQAPTNKAKVRNVAIAGKDHAATLRAKARRINHWTANRHITCHNANVHRNRKDHCNNRHKPGASHNNSKRVRIKVTVSDRAVVVVADVDKDKVKATKDRTKDRTKATKANLSNNNKVTNSNNNHKGKRGAIHRVIRIQGVAKDNAGAAVGDKGRDLAMPTKATKDKDNKDKANKDNHKDNHRAIKEGRIKASDAETIKTLKTIKTTTNRTHRKTTLLGITKALLCSRNLVRSIFR